MTNEINIDDTIVDLVFFFQKSTTSLVRIKVTLCKFYFIYYVLQ